MIFRFLLLFFSLTAWSRETTFPYLSADAWYFFADWKLSQQETFDPRQVQRGDVVLIEDVGGTLWKALTLFEEDYLPQIQHPFILITPRTDYSLPGRFAHLAEHEKIAVWFVQNIDRTPTEKLQPVPIGQANKSWHDPALLGTVPLNRKRELFLYVNFATVYPDRKKCWKACKKLKQAALYETPVPYDVYLEHLSRSVFVASPFGNGPDCHRTWEALLMGCYPIVRSSPLNALYEGLPVVIVEDWAQLTAEFLERKKAELDKLVWAKEKLYAPYWFDKIRAIQAKIRGVHK